MIFFPKMFDKAGGAALGFICGYAFSCTMLISLCIMPCSRGKIDWLCTRDNLRNISAPGILNVCNFVGWYSLECFNGDVEEAVEQLLALNDNQEEQSEPSNRNKLATHPDAVVAGDSTVEPADAASAKTASSTEAALNEQNGI